MNSETSLSARIFNDYIAAVAIAASNELGILDELARTGSLNLRRYVEEHRLHAMGIDAIVEVLSLYGVLVNSSEDIAQPGQHFDEIYKTKGYFTWLASGYGPLFQKLSALCRVEKNERSPGFAVRNPMSIALGGRDYGRQFVNEEVERVLRAKDFHTIADLGCGSADRLIRIAVDHPVKAIGIDIDPGVIEIASRAISDAGLDDRIQLLHADIRKLEPSPLLAEVDLITSFFNAHDLWPRESCVATLAQIRQSFPSASRFLLCDTYRAPWLENIERVPIFTLGFHLTHAVMGQYLPTRDEWLGLFEESGWRCRGAYEIGIPFSAIFDLAPI